MTGAGAFDGQCSRTKQTKDKKGDSHLGLLVG